MLGDIKYVLSDVYIEYIMVYAQSFRNQPIILILTNSRVDQINYYDDKIHQ